VSARTGGSELPGRHQLLAAVEAHRRKLSLVLGWVAADAGE